MIGLKYTDLPAMANPWGMDAVRMYDTPFGEILHLTLKPGQHVRAHRSPVDTVFYLLEGAVNLDLDGQSQTLEVGHMVVSEAGKVHAFANLAPAPARMMVIKFPKPASPVEFIGNTDH